MERQCIREIYKQLVVDAKKCVEENNMDGIVKICNEMKKIFDEVKYTREAILDITLMNHLANFSYKKIQTIETNFIYFDPRVFIQKLLECDRESIRSDFCRVSYAPPVPFIVVNSGSINTPVEPPTRKRRSIHIDSNGITSELVKVSKVHGSDVESNVTDENNFSMNIIRVFDMVENFVKNGHTPVYLSDVLAKAKDFSQAVDFNFCISFLVRDGRLKMEAKSNDISQITLEPLKKEENCSKSNLDTALKKSQYEQMVIPLCFDAWKKHKMEERRQ